MEFTSDWFTRHIPLWWQHLGPLSGRRLRVLEIGSHEGRSAVWLLAHLLTHPESELHCVDPWESPEVWNRFQANISETGRSSQVTVYRGRSGDQLRSLTGEFDLIYIDGDHEACSVLTDAILSWEILAPDGMLIFDDYGWNGNVECPPRAAIDPFLNLWMTQVNVLHKRYQVILRRRSV